MTETEHTDSSGAKRGRWLIVAAGSLVSAAIGTADVLAGDGVSLTVGHVIVIGAVGWRVGFAGGMTLASGAAIVTAAATWLQGATPAATATTVVAALAVFGVVAVATSRARHALAHQRRDAHVDPLTGARTRHGFDVVAEHARLRAVRDDENLSVACFDLDDFKAVNDAHGRKAGDQMLASFVAAIASSVRSTDIVARVGGDEFLMLLPSTDARQALVVVERVQSILADTSAHLDEPVTMSVGIATYRRPPDSLDDVVAAADDLMYEAKARGGDTVVGQLIVGSAATADAISTGTGATYSEARSA